ncbi:MAG: aminotransferase class I/II-fold pyridoxal phosphate-dependent enzyme, partial [Ignavibacteriales bacterium]|nr:aminotransferase class I/II-fold pyridoxal phosphate-dependent enzyme [Ignavibacteriales bacterium]
KTLLERILDSVTKNDINKIVIVIGYKGENVVKLIGDRYNNTPVEYVNNKIYDKTNNIYSLYLAKDYLTSDDSILFESDLVFEDKIVSNLLSNPFPNLAVVAKFEPWMDGTVTTIDDDNLITGFIPKSQMKYKRVDKYYKTVNIYKLSKEFCEKSFVPFLTAYTRSMGDNEYYEQVLRVITFIEKQSLKAYPLTDEIWYEIDDIQDLNTAELLLADEDKVLELYQKRWGGYWRFPKLLDFCYLVNPYFPTKEMELEIMRSFSHLLHSYPSGINVQNLLAAKMFDLDQENIVVGNGAAELIRSLMNNLDGTFGISSPTFQEYPNRLQKERVKYFKPFIISNSPFYGFKELEMISKEVDNVILINPDNPSGNLVRKNDVIRLIENLKKQNKRLILDESFMDFAENSSDESLLNYDLVKKYNNLIIVKSISKSYGIPGFRLGVIISSDLEVISKTKGDVSIWNINSFGEYFMQIFGKYQKDYINSCKLIRAERDSFFEKLKCIKFLEVFPSHANYFLCRVKEKFTATELTKLLLTKHNIFIKDLTNKPGLEKGEFIRIAVRNTSDNNTLINILLAL